MRQPRKRQIQKWWKQHPYTIRLETTADKLREAFTSASNLNEYTEYLYQCGVRTMFKYLECQEHVIDKNWSVLRFKKKR